MSSPIRRGASSPPSSPRSEGARSPVDEDRFDRFHDDDNDIIRAADDDVDEEDGEDLGENIMDDYKAAPELDVYEDEGVDNEVVEEIDHEARLRAERVMRKRDMQAARRDYEMQDSEDEEDDEVEGRRRRRRIDIGDENAVEDRGSDDKEELDKLTGFPLKEILVLQGPQRIIKQHYREFLQHPNNQQAINRMCVDNKQSLLVSYKDLARRKPLLAMWIADSPKKMLELFD